MLLKSIALRFMVQILHLLIIKRPLMIQIVSLTTLNVKISQRNKYLKSHTIIHYSL